MSKYLYDGPVMKFDICVATRWTAETSAKSPAEAKNHLSYRWKREHGLISQSKITLPGKITLIE